MNDACIVCTWPRITTWLPRGSFGAHRVDQLPAPALATLARSVPCTLTNTSIAGWML